MAFCFHASLFFFGSVSDALLSQKSQHHVPAVSPQLLATPTEVLSQDKVRRRSISSVDETLILSPVPTVTPTTTPTTCAIVSVPSDIITCPADTKEESPGGSETRIQTDPGNKHLYRLYGIVVGNLTFFLKVFLLYF